MTPLLLAALLAIGQNRVVNGQVETRPASQPLDREVAALSALSARGGARWVGYRIRTLGGHRSFDCVERSRIALEPAGELTILARFEGGAVVRLRTATPDCEIDAGGLPVTWLEGVKPDDSAAWLASLISTRPGQSTLSRATDDGHDRVTRPALVALAMHEGSGASRALVAIARDHPVSRMRSDALFWLAQRAGDQAVATITAAVDRDPDVEVKRRAVFALSQLPRDEGVPKLIEVARGNRDASVRRQAMFWLGQSNDPRALSFFEQVLLK